MVIKCVCVECKHEFSTNTVSVNEATINLGRQALMLVYFTCPKCNKIYRITLKDKQYEKLKKDLDNAKARIRRNYGSKNEEFASMLSSIAIKKYERLKCHLDNLNRKYPGTFTFVASENNHKDKNIVYLP